MPAALSLVQDTAGAAAASTPAPARRPLGLILIENGAVAPAKVRRALALQRAGGAPIGQILLSHGWVAERALAEALAEQAGAGRWTGEARPDARLIDALGPETCLRTGVLPIRRCGGATIVASHRPERFETHRPEIEARLGPVRMLLSDEAEAIDALVESHGDELREAAETRTPEVESCRDWGRRPSRLVVPCAAVAMLALAIAFPAGTLLTLTLIAVAFLTAATALRTAAAVSQLAEGLRGSRRFRSRRADPVIARLPVVSLIVPLFHERTIVAECLGRLARLTYPRHLLDVVFVIEASDSRTAAALAASPLPTEMRVVTVPEGTIRTKPRALNFAMDFCEGTIVGIYDAEDAPEPDQIDKVVTHFYRSGPEVACLQGRLDFYNSRQNWLSRCFTLDYAVWFRVVLPGLARLGFSIPLGGTTVFFRRGPLEELGRWDAHNVTEDADLGIRLARHGYRTELVDSTTYEEANCVAGGWVRQRSRWLKGYAMTYAVHMRDPRRLWRELGPKRFLGFQILFLGTLVLFTLAPVLWTFWAIPLGLGHPLEGVLPRPAMLGLSGLFLTCEVLSLATAALAVSTPKRRWLIPWAITLQVYFALGALAALKGLSELAFRPFFWDKTRHGIAVQDAAPGVRGGGGL